MSWIIPASAVLLIVAIAEAARRASRRRNGQRPAISTTTEENAIGDPTLRVQQFRETGSHRMPEPKSSATDLRREVQAMLQDADMAADLTTLDAFLSDVRDSVGADEAIFWRWSEAKDKLTPASWSTPGVKLPAHFDKNAWGALVQWAAEGRVIHFDAEARVGVVRLAAAPVEQSGRLMGVLSVSRADGLDRGRDFVKAWLPRHAAQVGRLVQLFELRGQYGRRMRQNQALLEAAKKMQAHPTQEALYHAICDTAQQVSSATDAALIRWRSDAARGWVQYTTEGFAHKAPFPLTSDSLAGGVCAEGMPLLIEDVSRMTGKQSLFFDEDGAWPRGTVGIVPLMLENRVIGALVVASDRPGRIAEEETRNIALLGALAATSLEIFWEMEEVTRRARTDALTGLPNRRAFDEQLQTLIGQADRFGHTVSLIMADVDQFKQVNDTWGHDAGDLVLKSIARTLTDGVRGVDTCARFGGEEIAILLPQTALPGAAELADRLRRAVEAVPVRAGGNEIPVTISCGVASYPDGALTKEALFAAADRALYDAKSAGRNCVRVATPRRTGIAT